MNKWRMIKISFGNYLNSALSLVSVGLLEKTLDEE